MRICDWSSDGCSSDLPRPRCRSGRRRAAWRCRPIPSSSARDRLTRRISRSRRASPGRRWRRARVRRNDPPSRPPRRCCWNTWREMTEPESGRDAEGRTPQVADTGTRCGYVAIIGAPNAGKSTLLNLLAGSKLSIVSPKVQTTRSRVLGIRIEGDAQVIFVDTPGIFAPRRRLDRAMVSAAWEGAGDADLVLLMVDAERGLDEIGRA